jgi:hypothetical protein
LHAKRGERVVGERRKGKGRRRKEKGERKQEAAPPLAGEAESRNVE